MRAKIAKVGKKPNQNSKPELRRFSKSFYKEVEVLLFRECAKAWDNQRLGSVVALINARPMGSVAPADRDDRAFGYALCVDTSE